MVAEGGRYKTSSTGRAQSVSATHSTGNYGSTTHTSYASDTSPLPGVSSAPAFGRIRITQSVERDVRSGGLGGAYTSGIATSATPSQSRRFSLSTDRILPRDKTLHSSFGGARPLHQTPYQYQRRASIASSTLRSKISNHHLLTTDDDDEDVASSLDRSAAYSHPYHHTTGSAGASAVSQRGSSVRASSVSKYDSQNSVGRSSADSSLYESYNGRAPSVSRYESQTSFVRSPSVSRYEGQISNGRAPSLSRYENQTPRAPSLSRYDSQSSVSSLSRYEGYAATQRAPSIPRYESHSSIARPPSVSRYEGYTATPRAPSVSRYESHGSVARAPSVSRYEGYAATPRAPSIPRYDSQSSVARAPSVSLYEGYGSAPRAPSVSRYESQGSIARTPSVSNYELHGSTARAVSVSRYERHGSVARAPSESRYEVYGSTARAPSVSRYEGHTPVRHRFRSASVSRYERSTRFAAPDEDDLNLDYTSGTRSISASRSSEHLVDRSTADDDADYELRRQLRAMRNQQIRGGSVARHDRPSAESHVIHHHEAATRPRSLSISSHNRDLHHHHQQRRYKVHTVQSPIKVASPASGPLITGYPEPTLYSAQVFRTHDVARSTGDNIAATSTEAAFIDNREDITSFVLKPGEKFLPTDVSVSLLPSGKKAVTYTQFSQKGTGDQRSANEQIERIITKTRILQDSMHTLEDFVKRNRSLFPEDIIIYQKITFYLLSEAELIKMGERPDAEIYGVKIRERLVAPRGTDVATILKRFYSRHKEVEVEYEHVDVIRKQLQQSEMEAAAAGRQPPPRRARTIHEELNLEKPGDLPHGWRSRSSELYIDEDELLRRDGMARSPKMGQRPSGPEFTHRLRGQRAAVGQSVRLSCSVSAFPEPVVTWYRGKQEITENGRFSVKHNNYSGLCTLTISDLTPEDGVLYTVRAVNSEGEAATSGLLEVYDLPESSAYAAAAAQRQPLPHRRRSAEPNGTAATGRRPFFLLEARNLWADVGEKAVFEVQAAGKPLPSFTWVKDDCPVTEDDHVQFLSDGYGNCKLVIREIRQSDFGTYRCLAQNDDGLIESIASLFCVGNESLRPGQELRNELRSTAGQHRGRKPQFVHAPPSRVDVIEGEPLTLQCTVDGDPKPLITWYKGVRELTYTGRHRVLEERNNCYVMQLKSTLATDSGEYTVTAHNLCGLVESIIYVNVLPGERSLDDFDPNWKKLDLTPLEYDLVNKTRQGKMPPIFVKRLPREKQMKVGTSLKFDCFIEVTKPKEYLVDVDIVRRGDKKEDTVPQRIATKEGRKILLDAEKPQHKTSDDSVGQERSLSKDNVSSPQPAVFNSKADDAAKSNQLPADHADHEIVQLAENLARQISNEAVETVQKHQQQQHDSIIHQRNAGHELKVEDQESITEVKGHGVISPENHEGSDLKADDKMTETKSEDTPTETKAEDTPTETKAEDTPTEAKAEDTPTDTKADDASLKADATPTVFTTQDRPTTPKTEEEPVKNVKVAESGASGESAEQPAVRTAETTPAELGTLNKDEKDNDDAESSSSESKLSSSESESESD